MIPAFHVGGEALGDLRGLLAQTQEDVVEVHEQGRLPRPPEVVRHTEHLRIHGPGEPMPDSFPAAPTLGCAQSLVGIVAESSPGERRVEAPSKRNTGANRAATRGASGLPSGKVFLFS